MDGVISNRTEVILADDKINTGGFLHFKKYFVYMDELT